MEALMILLLHNLSVVCPLNPLPNIPIILPVILTINPANIYDAS